MVGAALLQLRWDKPPERAALTMLIARR